MRIGILTDVHGNLPALRAALERTDALCCEVIYHTGDLIGIGPFPAECLDTLLQRADTRLLMGNHDALFAVGLPSPHPTWLSEGEIAHQTWTHAQIDPTLRTVVASWPYLIREEIAGVRLVFVHYALKPSGTDFQPIARQPTGTDLDALFGNLGADLVFYGHHHLASDLVGGARYVNPGSLGCNSEPWARFVTLDCHDGAYTLQHHIVPYDPRDLFVAFEARAVPERAFILRTFFGVGSPR